MKKLIFCIYSFIICIDLYTENHYAVITRDISKEVICHISIEDSTIILNVNELLNVNLIIKNISSNILYLSDKIYSFDMSWYFLHIEKTNKFCNPIANAFINLLDEKDNILYYNRITDLFAGQEKDNFKKVMPGDSLNTNFRIYLPDFIDTNDNINHHFKLSIYYFNCDLGDNWDFVPWTGMTKSNTIEFQVE
jgi:hypothetical protein